MTEQDYILIKRWTLLRSCRAALAEALIYMEGQDRELLKAALCDVERQIDKDDQSVKITRNIKIT